MLLRTRVKILEGQVLELTKRIQLAEIAIGVGKADRRRLESLIVELRTRLYPLFREGADNNEKLISQSHTHDT